MRSLKARLVLVATIWVTVGVGVAGVLLSAVFKDFLVQQFYDHLHVHLDELEKLMDVDAKGQLRILRPLSDPRYAAHLSGLYWEIQRNGNLLARSASLEGPMLKIPADEGSDAQVHTHEVAGPTGDLLIAERFRWIGTGKEPVRVIVGADKSQLDIELLKFNYVLLWSLGAFWLSMIAAGIVLLLYAMAPFGHLRAALAKVREGTESNLRGKFPDEVQPLIDDLNNLLAASGEQMQRARAQAGNIAHGLKTPLAILVDEADQLGQKGEQKPASIILDQCRRMQAQIDYQIARARVAATGARPGTASSLTVVAENVVRALRRLHVERGIRIDNELPSGEMVACDAQDLNEMLANLIDNACKHARTRVLLRRERDRRRDFVRVVIEDDGVGLPPEAWAVVFNIGEQWNTPASGAGLGLPIVRDLAHLYGGDVRLDHSPLGGLKVILKLPTFSREKEPPGPLVALFATAKRHGVSD